MAEKQRGRPKGDLKMVSLYTRVPEEEAAAFEAYVRMLSIRASGNPDALKTSGVLRGLINAAMKRETDASLKETLIAAAEEDAGAPTQTPKKPTKKK